MAIGVQHQQQQHGTGSPSSSSTSPLSQRGTATAAGRPLPITPSIISSVTSERPLPNPHSPVSPLTTRSGLATGVVISTPVVAHTSPPLQPVHPPHRQSPPPGVAGSYSRSTSMGQNQSSTAATATPSPRSVSASLAYPSSGLSPAPPSLYTHHTHDYSTSSAPAAPTSTAGKGGLFKRALGGVVGGTSGWRKKSDSANPFNSRSTPPIDGRRSPAVHPPPGNGGKNLASHIFSVTPTSKKSKTDLPEENILPTPPPKSPSTAVKIPGDSIFAHHQMKPPVPATAKSLQPPEPGSHTNRASIIPVTPAISSAVNYMCMNTPDAIEEIPTKSKLVNYHSVNNLQDIGGREERKIVHEEDEHDDDDIVLVNKADFQGARRVIQTPAAALRSASVPRSRGSGGASESTPVPVPPEALIPPIPAPVDPTTSFPSASGTPISSPSSPVTSTAASHYAPSSPPLSSPTQKDKEVWRQSDSTIGHRTLRRPNAHVAMQESRPVSMADSVMSSRTVVPGSFATPTATIAGSPVGGGHKRLSALITDADFGMPEEFEEIEYSDVEGHEEEQGRSASRSGMRGGRERENILEPPATPAKDTERSATPLHAMYASALASMSVSPAMSSSSYNPEQYHSLDLERQDSLTPSSFSRKSRHSRSGSADISRPSSPSAASHKSKNRRSMSLSISSHAAAFSKTASSAAARLLRSPERGTASDTEGTTKIQQRRIYVQHSPDVSSGSGYSTGSLPRSRLNPGHTAPSSPAISHDRTPPQPLSTTPSAASMTSKGWKDRSLPALPPTSPIPIAQNNPLLFPKGPPSPPCGTSRGQNPATPNYPSHTHISGGLRQTAISITNGLAPAAGLAKRAVEKMNRAFGGHGHSQSYSPSGKESILTTGTTSSSSVSSGTPPSSYSGVGGSELRRTGSNHSHSQSYSHPHQVQPQQEQKIRKKIRLRRTPNAPSISSTASSVSHSTTASASDSEVFSGPTGPILGVRLREGWVPRGLVFGKHLKNVVVDTAIWVGSDSFRGESDYEGESDDVDEMGVVRSRRRNNRKSVKRGQLEALEERMLPAIVVRCAQHILIWGIQEEGLFRVPGRSAHISRLKAEFDSGADYDMAQCSPGELDPHAVASTFKAFLRELPEPILTRELSPYFDAAMSREQSQLAASSSSEDAKRPRSDSRGQRFPSDSRPNPTSNSASSQMQMRKPPSLSTLAMPTFNALKPSQALTDDFYALLSQLPVENKDLLRTVIELIQATAKDHKDTKMPLSNLLLIFCPSLGMSPLLLRVLCEAEGLWDERAKEVLDIQREDIILDIKGLDTSDDLDGSSVSSNDALRGGTARQHIPTVYLDAETGSSSSLSQHLPPSLEHSQDDGSSFVSTAEDQANCSSCNEAGSPLLFTSSAESLNTPPPSSSIGQPLTRLPFKEPEQRSFGSEQEGPGGSPVISSSPVGPRRPVISSPIPITEPVHFPSSPSGTIGPLLTEAEKRRSVQLLSLPSFSPNPIWIDTKFGNMLSTTASLEDGSQQSPARLNVSPKAKKLINKKPSLQLLFSKKSSSSLSSSCPIQKSMISGPYLHTPNAASESSMSTPISALTTHTAPQSSMGDLLLPMPTNVESTIETSSVKVLQTPATPPDSNERSSRSRRPGLPSSASSSSLPLSARGGTPIADRYARTPSPSPSVALSFMTSASQDQSTAPPPSSYHLRSTMGRGRGKDTGRERGASVSSNASATSSNHLDLLDDSGFDEDWTKTVLLAADFNVDQ